MNKNELKQVIMNYIERNAGTTFAELERLFERYGYDYIGDHEYTAADDPNHIYWLGWSSEYFSIMRELRQDGYIVMKPASTLIYMIDGKGLTFPVAKTERRKKNPHWLPVSFSITSKAKNGEMTFFDAMDILLAGGAK